MKTKNCMYGISVLLALSSLGLTARAQAFVSGKIGVDVGNCPVTAPCRSITYSLTQAASGGALLFRLGPVGAGATDRDSRCGYGDGAG